MTKDQKPPIKPERKGVDASATKSSASELDAFLHTVKNLKPVNPDGAQGRLIFAMDATMSRRPTWDMALNIQADMFHEVAALGGLEVQLVYFRGFDECRASKWVSNPKSLAKLMVKVDCQGGHTQIARVLKHACQETQIKKVGSLVYVGDSMEENIDDLAAHAGTLALHGVPVFLFQEGDDVSAQKAFRELARITSGAYCRFDAGSAKQLRELLAAVAVYAAGGRKALQDFSKAQGGQAQFLLEQLK